MTITSATKVRDVALQLPQSTRVFEKLNIDYCCGGDQPFVEACATAGVEFESVVQMIDQLTLMRDEQRAPDLQNATLTELITYILEKHHTYTKDEMDRLEPLSEKVVAAHGANHPELIAVSDLLRQLFADLRPHMLKEERILFPFILELERSQTQNGPAPFAPFGTVQYPIRMMLMEHDTAGDILRKMRKLSFEYKVPQDACVSYKTFYEALATLERDLHQHIHLENNLLFPKAIALEGAVEQGPI